MSNSSRALLYLIPCIVVSVALNFTKFFETETVSYCMDFTACGCGYHSRMYVRPTKLRLSRNYIMFYTTWTWVSMTSIIPFLILAILNWVIWRRLRAAQETSKMLKTNDKHQDKVKLSSPGILFPYQFTFFDFCIFCCFAGAQNQPVQHHHPLLHRHYVPYLPQSKVHKFYNHYQHSNSSLQQTVPLCVRSSNDQLHPALPKQKTGK